VLEAAYALGKPSHERVWLTRTVTAWDDLRTRDRALAQTYAGDAAFASFTLLDAEIKGGFDKKQAYPAPVPAVLAAFAKNAELAAQWDARLEDEVIRKYASREWTPIAYARRGAIFDALRTGLYDTVKVKLFDAREEALLARLRASGNPTLVAKAYQL